MSSHSTPRRSVLAGPSRTPRPSIGISASSSSSTSSPSALGPSLPFDWDAARGLKPPPYGYATPNQGSRLRQSVGGSSARKSMGVGRTGGALSPLKRIPLVRSVSWIERLQNWPSQISFQLSLFPHNVPLPHPRTSARIVAATLNTVHLVVRYSQVRQLRDDELGWEDMVSETNALSLPGLSWLTLLNFACVMASLANAAYLASRTREYTHFYTRDPLPTQHARFVPAEEIFKRDDDEGEPAIARRLARVAWKLVRATWRWLSGAEGPAPIQAMVDGRVIQKVDMWMPEEFEKTLFALYSPVHAVLWLFWSPQNWLGVLIALGLLSAQLSILMKAYDALVKDTRILGASVLQEYDEKYVQPRINVVKRDAIVQTHEAEMIDWRPNARKRYSQFESVPL
ncbi:hypothetical protein EXIGLDRAFT_779236 [Exidia glandulosa HHB12029]|uniref:Nuclear rim protein 1 n=1 Tax=Exidia glandulosa HHB12029 TaxID=1314781 RepID=A0A165C5E0_EXIGL|nr:hypothetical protein EXIGLDRAFT_779236 [Exidia glandulosa HHB12029]